MFQRRFLRVNEAKSTALNLGNQIYFPKFFQNNTKIFLKNNTALHFFFFNKLDSIQTKENEGI